MSTFVFDLDGTLTDSAPGIEWAAHQAVLDACPEHELLDFGAAIGARVPELFARCLPRATPSEIAAASLAFRRCYDDQGWRRSSLFSGIAEMLKQLRDGGHEIDLVTNKPSAPTKAMLALHGITSYFDVVVCPDSGSGHLNKADALIWLVVERALDRAATTYVGDTAEDLEAASAAGIGFVAAAYGYGRSGLEAASPSRVCSDPMLLLDILTASTKG